MPGKRLPVVIRIKMTRQDTNHSDGLRHHYGRAICEVAGRRFETKGPASIYKLVTLLWLHGHGDADFEVYDDWSPFGGPGGLAMHGRVRNWARLTKGKPRFDQKAQNDPELTPDEKYFVAEAAGRVTGSPPRIRPSGDQPPTAPNSLQDGPNCLREKEDASKRIFHPSPNEIPARSTSNE